MNGQALVSLSLPLSILSLPLSISPSLHLSLSPSLHLFLPFLSPFLVNFPSYSTFSLSLSLLLLLSTMFIISIVCPHTLHLSLSLFLCCIEGSCKVGSACPGTWILVSTSPFTVGIQRIF